jgi:hypothetical protein
MVGVPKLSLVMKSSEEPATSQFTLHPIRTSPNNTEANEELTSW